MSERPEGRHGDFVQDGNIPASENAFNAGPETASEHSLGNDLRSEGDETDRLRGELDALNTEHQALHDKYVRLHAEFDNYRKRTAKERILDLLQSAGAETLISILPVLDDMERAITHNAEVDDIEVVKQGFDLIHQKFANILLAHGLKLMRAKGEAFDPDLYEAISKVPAPSTALRGKVIDVVENGYTLHDKVVRYAKVVVGE